MTMNYCRVFRPALARAFSTNASKNGRVICITSGKGGVGKTTTAASFAYGLAQLNPDTRTCVVDFDIGLRNLDIHLGMERRVIFDFVNVLLGECSLNQALIKDKRLQNLYLLAASQTRDKDVLTLESVEECLSKLKQQFDYVILDSPAGIESGAKHAMYFADDAILVTNPELSSCRDCDKMIGFISSQSQRAVNNHDEPVSQQLLITRYDVARVNAEESLSLMDIEELLGLPVIGVVPESKSILTCTNVGVPVVSLCFKQQSSRDSNLDTKAAEAYKDMCHRYMGEEREFRFIKEEEKKGFFANLFSSS